MAKIAWIDSVIEKLESGPHREASRRAEVIGFLQQDRAKLLEIARRLEVEAQHVAYPHLRDEIHQLVEKKRGFAEKLRALVEELGGRVEADPEPETVFPRGNFRDVFNAESELYDQLTDHSNLAEDYRLFHVAKQLRDVKTENNDLVEKLEQIIMRINAEI
jgi:FtsZ-binding cell division protein ZapB